MSDKEEALIHEILSLAYSYSQLRHDGSKWSSEPIVCIQVCDQVKTYDGVVVTLFMSRSEELAFLISRPLPAPSEYYTVKDILTRVSLKRSPDTFQSLYTLWRSINPIRKKSISKDTYLKLTETVASALDLRFSSHYALQDMRVDFRSRNSLGFRDFYDSFFQMMDNAAGTKSVTEYVKLVATVCNALLNAKWCKRLGGNGQEGRTIFDPWMMPFLQSSITQKLTKSSPGTPIYPSKKSNMRHQSLGTALQIDINEENPLTFPHVKETKSVSKVNIEVKFQPQPPAKSTATGRSRPGTSKYARKMRTKSDVTDYNIDLIRVVSRSPSPRRGCDLGIGRSTTGKSRFSHI